MDKIKIAIGLVIIVASFVYILRNKGSMLDNLLAKSKKEYEQRPVSYTHLDVYKRQKHILDCQSCRRL